MDTGARKKWVLPTVILLLLVAFPIIYMSYQEKAIERQEKVEALHRNRELCLTRLQIKHDMGFRPVMMACAHEYIEQELVKGVNRGVAAENAWNQCMPKLDVCEKALR